MTPWGSFAGYSLAALNCFSWNQNNFSSSLHPFHKTPQISMGDPLALAGKNTIPGSGYTTKMWSSKVAQVFRAATHFGTFSGRRRSNKGHTKTTTKCKETANCASKETFKTYQFYYFDEDPVVGWTGHQFEEKWSKGQVILWVLPRQFTDHIDRSRLYSCRKREKLQSENGEPHNGVTFWFCSDVARKVWCTWIWIFQLFLETWECRPQSFRKFQKHFVHDQYGFLPQVRLGWCHLLDNFRKFSWSTHANCSQHNVQKGN